MTERCPMTRNGKHNWTDWGQFKAVPPKFSLISPHDPPTAERTAIEAYRWRGCECGAGERETFASGKREVFSPDEVREVYSRV